MEDVNLAAKSLDHLQHIARMMGLRKSQATIRKN